MHWLLSQSLDVILGQRCRFKSCALPPPLIVHLPFLFIVSHAYIKQARSMPTPLHRRWTHCSNSNLDVWLGEWVSSLLLHLPHLLHSGGCDHDPAGLMGKPAFVLFSVGWLVHDLRAQGVKRWLDVSLTGSVAMPGRGPGTWRRSRPWRRAPRRSSSTSPTHLERWACFLHNHHPSS